MTLKERLDAVWNDKRIASATHWVKWNEKGRNSSGYSTFDEFKLWYYKGRKAK